MSLNSWINLNLKLRNQLIQRNSGEYRYLLASFKGSEQRKDIEKRTDLIGDYARVKINVKRLDNAQVEKDMLSPVDLAMESEILGAIANEFDMPAWATERFNLPLFMTPQYNHVFITQTKGCNIHCPWCYVDDKNKNGLQGDGAEYFSGSEIIDKFQERRAMSRNPLNMIRFSGGEPLLTPEAWVDLLDDLRHRDLEDEVYFQGETNLMPGRLIQRLQEGGELKKDFFNLVGQYNNFGVLCSFKGTDKESFLHATGMPQGYSFLEEDRWELFGKMVDAGIDVYPFIYDANPNTLESFLEKGETLFEGFVEKAWIFPLKLYGPEKTRMLKKGLNPLDEQKRLDENYAKAEEIMKSHVSSRGRTYKGYPRSQIKISRQKT